MDREKLACVICQNPCKRKSEPKEDYLSCKHNLESADRVIGYLRLQK